MRPRRAPFFVDDGSASREHSPMRPAADAGEVDTTGLGIDDVVARIVALVGARAS